MNKREFLKCTSYAGIGLMSSHLFPFHDSRLVEKKLPSKWVWLRPDPKKSTSYWDTIFGNLSDCGIEAVLPQVYASRDTLFYHPDLPVKDKWLERIIPIAQAHGLEVHAWMWSMPLNNEQLIEKHPDWFSVNREGNPSHTHPAYVNYYKFLDPCHPEVMNFVQNNVKALAQIENLDGIHLDYIRQPDVILAKGLQPKYDIVQDKEYAQYDYPYSSYCRNGFKDKYGYDPIELGDKAPSDEKWRQYRYDAITNLVNEYLVPAAKEKNKTITAAVFPNWESVRQQWHNWDLDGFLPMLYQGFYEENIDWIGEQVSAARKRLNNDKPIYSGLFIPHLKNNEELDQAINVSINSGAAGYCLFAHGNLTKSHFKYLKTKNSSL